jgi:hypothetical protein
VGRTLKDQNLWKLWAIVATNIVFLYGATQANKLTVNGIRSLFTDPHSVVSVGIAVFIVTVLNGVLSPDTKARLVFMKWRYPLPGHRAFSKYARADTRIDIQSLERMHGAALPVDPGEQNRLWYRILKTIENRPTVMQAHRDFLLLRDYAGLSFLFFLLYGPVSLCVVASLKIAGGYILLLLVQYVIARQAASNYGIRLVTTVLAEEALTRTPTRSRARRKSSASLESETAQHPA